MYTEGCQVYFGNTKIISKGYWCPVHYILIVHPEKNSYKNLYEQPWSVQLPYETASSFNYINFLFLRCEVF